MTTTTACPRRFHPQRFPVVVAVAVRVLVASCGDDADSTSPTAAPADTTPGDAAPDDAAPDDDVTAAEAEDDTTAPEQGDVPESSGVTGAVVIIGDEHVGTAIDRSA